MRIATTDPTHRAALEFNFCEGFFVFELHVVVETLR